jgi:hypothetical protein
LRSPTPSIASSIPNYFVVPGQSEAIVVEAAELHARPVGRIR